MHLLDYAITQKSSLTEVLTTKVMRGAECLTDHYMVHSKLRLKLFSPKRKTPSNTTTKKLDVEKLRNEEVQMRLAMSITQL